MAIEIERPYLESPAEVSGRNGNGHTNGNGRLPEDLVEYSGFIAANAAKPDQNPDLMKLGLVGIGVRDLKTQLRIVNWVGTARREIVEEKGRLGNRSSSE